MKKIISLFFMVTIFFVIEAMDQVIVRQSENNEGYEVTPQGLEENLNRAYVAHEMRWVPDMYEASGLSCQMSRPFFIVTVLDQIKRKIQEQECLENVQDSFDNTGRCLISDACCSGLVATQFLASFFSLLGMCVYGFSSTSGPIEFSGPVDTSCFRALQIFNYTQGMEWAQNCIKQSLLTDTPCNVTAARLAAAKTGYFYQPSQCCFNMADPVCYQQGLKYNNETYPTLHAQAVLDNLKPLMVAAPTVVALQLAILAGYKIRRYLREKAPAPFKVATEQP